MFLEQTMWYCCAIQAETAEAGLLPFYSESLTWTVDAPRLFSLPPLGVEGCHTWATTSHPGDRASCSTAQCYIYLAWVHVVQVEMYAPGGRMEHEILLYMYSTRARWRGGGGEEMDGR